MQNAEADHDDIEARIGKGQVAGIALAERDDGMQRGSLGDHRRREIQPGDFRTARRRGGGDVAGAGGNVEHIIASLYVYGVEQRLDALRGQCAEIIFVELHHALPGAVLEFTESGGSGVCGFHGWGLKRAHRKDAKKGENATI